MNKKMYYACNEVKNTGADIEDRGGTTDISGKLDTAVFDSVFSIEKDEQTQAIKSVRVLTNLYAEGNVAAYSDGDSGEGSGGGGGIGTAELEKYLTDNQYATQPWVNEQGFLKSVTKAMVEGVLTGNITSHTHNYLPVSGGNLTGALTINNNVVYHAGNYNPAYKWVYHPSKGCLVKTDIAITDNVTDAMFTFRIIGNSYSSKSPICAMIQGYYYHTTNTLLSVTGINMGDSCIGQVKVFVYEGVLCLFFEQANDGQSFGIYAETGYDNGNTDCKQNRVVSILRQAMPTSGVSRSVTVTLRNTYNTTNANLSTVDWAAKNMTVAGSVKIGSVTLSDDNGKLKIDKEVYSTGGITAFGDGTVGGGSGGGGMGTAELEKYLTDNSYVTEPWVDEQGFLKSITKAMVEAVLTDANLGGTLKVNGYQVWHAGNSNLTSVDWVARALTALNGLKIPIAANVTTASGVKWLLDGAESNMLSSVGNYNVNGAFEHIYLGWGNSPYLEINSFSVSPNKIKYKTRDIWHAGNSNLSTVDWMSKKLTASGDITTGGIIYNNGIGDSLYVARNGSTEQGRIVFGTKQAIISVANTNYDGSIILRPNGAAETFGQTVFDGLGNLISQGYVGIKTDTPQYPLDILNRQVYVAMDGDLYVKELNIKKAIDNLNSMFEYDAQGRIKAKAEFYSVAGVTAFGDGTVSGGTGGGGMGTAELEQYLTENGYATQSWVGSQSYLKSISKAMVEGVLTGNITSHAHSYLPLSGGNLTGALTVNGNTVYHSGNLDAVRFDEYQSKSAAERETAAMNVGIEAWKSGYTVADLNDLDANWFCAGNTPFESTDADDMIRYIHSGHTDDANVRHVGQLWFNGEDIRFRNKKGAGAWSALKSCIVKYCGGRLSQSETDRVVRTPSGLGSWIDSESYGIIMQYAAGQIGYGATVHQAVFTPEGFKTRYNVRPEIGQTTGWSEWAPLFGDASTSDKGLVQLAANSGTSTDSGLVPVLDSNGKLNENVLPKASDLGPGHIGAVEVVYNATKGNFGRVPMVNEDGILTDSVLPAATQSAKGSVLLATSGAGAANAGKVVALDASGMFPQEYVPSIPSNVPDASTTQKGVVRLSSGAGESGEAGSAAQVFDNGTISPYNMPDATIYAKGAVIKAENTGTSSDSGHVPVCGADGKLDPAVIPTTETKIKYGAPGTYRPSDEYDVIDVYLPGANTIVYLPSTTTKTRKKIRFQGAGSGYSLTVYDSYGRSDVFSFSGGPAFIKGYYIYETFGNNKLQLVSKFSYSSSEFDND